MFLSFFEKKKRKQNLKFCLTSKCGQVRNYFLKYQLFFFKKVFGIIFG